MTYDLYWVSVLGYIVITLIILIRERKYTHHAEKAGRVFMPLVCLSLVFYVVDFFWGMCLVDAIRSDAVYFVSSACSTSWLSSPPCRGFAMCCAT